MKSKIILVTGGARSGKSSFAERYAVQLAEKVSYIATAQAFDEEMEKRILLHRNRRPASWQTFEAPYDPELIIPAAAAYAKVILFDCLTLYATNLLLAQDVPHTPEERFTQFLNKIQLLLTSARAAEVTIIFVTNEVGWGIVPENKLAREYRDLAGIINQKVAAEADEVFLVVSGIGVNIKELAFTMNGEI